MKPLFLSVIRFFVRSPQLHHGSPLLKQSVGPSVSDPGGDCITPFRVCQFLFGWAAVLRQNPPAFTIISRNWVLLFEIIMLQ